MLSHLKNRLVVDRGFFYGLGMTQGYQLDQLLPLRLFKSVLLVYPMFFLLLSTWTLAHKILVTAQRPNFPFLILLLGI